MNRIRRTKWIVYLLDLCSLSACFLIANFLLQQDSLSEPRVDALLHAAPLFLMTASAAYFLFDVYEEAGRKDLSKQIYSLVISQMIVTVAWLLLNGALYAFTNGVAILSCLFQLVYLVIFRTVWFRLQIRRKGNKQRAWMIVRDSKSDAAFVDKIVNEGKKRFMLEGILQVTPDSMPVTELNFPDTDLVILSPNLALKEKAEWTRIAMIKEKEVLLVPEWYELMLTSAMPQQIHDMIVYSIVPHRLSLLDRAAKRVIDLSISSMLLILASPVMLLMMLLIPLTSKGKAFFRQERIGLEGKSFDVLKFRSMVEDAEKSTGPVLAVDRDDRITKLGKFIRATRIDELPQLFNVLKGEMSLVGPRPEREFFIEKFKKELPQYSCRLTVKPGLTGLAQVRGNYATSPSDKLRYDLIYIRDYSPWLDLKILLQTAVVVVQREASRGVQADVNPSGKFLKRLSNVQTEMVASQEQ